MVPANDNFVNAQLLTGIQGASWATNISASSEFTESTNNGSTVWYCMTGSAVDGDESTLLEYGRYYFSTRYNKTAGIIPLPWCATNVQVFTCNQPTASVGNLTEVNYETGSAWKSHYSHTELGSYVAFQLVTGSTCWIRVDSTQAGAQNQGNFPYSYGQHASIHFGSTPSMSISPDTTLLCPYPSISPMPGFNNDTKYFNGGTTIPAGNYRCQYAGGATGIANDVNDIDWIVDTGQSNAAFSHDTGSYRLTYQLNGTATTVSMSNHPPVLDGEVDDAGPSLFNEGPLYVNYGDAESQFFNFGFGQTIKHSGGQISLTWTTNPLGDYAGGPGICTFFTQSQDQTGSYKVSAPWPPVSGSQNPRFQLYRVLPVINFVNACVNWYSQSLNIATGSFIFNNTDIVSWDNVSASMLNAGGISGSALNGTNPISTLNVGNNTIDFAFTSSSDRTTAEIQLSSSLFPAITYLVNLSPTMIVNSANLGFASPTVPASCPSITPKLCELVVQNIGYWGMTNAPVTMSVNNGIQTLNWLSTQVVIGPHGPTNQYPVSCSANSPLYGNVSMNCNGGGSGQTLQFWFAEPTASTNATITLDFGSYGVVNYNTTFS